MAGNVDSCYFEGISAVAPPWRVLVDATYADPDYNWIPLLVSICLEQVFAQMMVSAEFTTVQK
eukprot:7455898-Karenia_brevis.AAC.1